MPYKRAPIRTFCLRGIRPSSRWGAVGGLARVSVSEPHPRLGRVSLANTLGKGTIGWVATLVVAPGYRRRPARFRRAWGQKRPEEDQPADQEIRRDPKTRGERPG